uniref:BTB domain-containing protein n=1 Tax=Panagrolaimus davidi TaxID=227884 RepID=A0A914Q0B3_9BILA
MASKDNTDLVYPIFIKWNFDECCFDEDKNNDLYLNDGELKLKTNRFLLPGFPVTYYLTLDFKKFDDKEPDISVKLHCYCDYNDIEIEADIMFTLKPNYGGPEVSQTQYTFDEDNTEIVCYEKAEWKHYTALNLYIIAKGTFTVKGLHLNPISIKVPKVKKQMFTDENGKNFTIIAEGQEIKVHKSILLQISPVFANMFESNWKESVEQKIEFKNLSFKLAKIAIDSFYGIKYWRFLDKIEYIQLFQFADQYDITSLKNAVKNSIILTPKNVVEYTNLVAENKCDELIRHCIDYLILCSQFSLEIKDVDKITDTVKIQIADRMFSSPVQKKNIENENTCKNECNIR